MNIISASLCSLYAAVIAICVGLAYRARRGNDSKGHFVFLQVPIALQVALLMRIGVMGSFRKISWGIAYLLFATPVFVILYVFGIAIQYLIKIRY
jgi:hypothetical protein